MDLCRAFALSQSQSAAYSFHVGTYESHDQGWAVQTFRVSERRLSAKASVARRPNSIHFGSSIAKSLGGWIWLWCVSRVHRRDGQGGSAEMAALPRVHGRAEPLIPPLSRPFLAAFVGRPGKQ
jgi:hypothetical protein